MYQMHKDVKYSTVTNCEEKNIVYKTKNGFAEDDREISCICEQPHLVKTTCNNLAHSGFNNTCTHRLWNDNYYLAWSHIKILVLDNLEVGV